jgi:opacity protein-like surface antigen
VSRKRVIAGTAAGILLIAGLAVAPALGAPDHNQRLTKRESPAAARALGIFTPASADPKLAAIFARSGLDATDFQFTPSEPRHAANRGVSLAVRGRSVRGTQDDARLAAATPTVALAPIAYNLGVSVGWKKFALSGDVSHFDMAGAPGGRQSVDVGVSYSAKRFSGQVKAVADRPLPGAPALVEEAPAYTLDVGGSYSLTRNLDVTAGVRYKTERNRLEQLDNPDTNNHHDSQAVYIGTAFRF